PVAAGSRRRPGHRAAVGGDPGACGWWSAVTVSRPRVIRAGDEIRVGGALHAVVAVSATEVRLADVVGAETTMPLAQVLSRGEVESVSAPRGPAPLPPSGLLDGLPDHVAEQARWWERHIIEVLTGVPADAAAGTRPRPAYDPRSRSLRKREL